MVHVMARRQDRLMRRRRVSLVRPSSPRPASTMPTAALAQVSAIYDGSVDHLRDALQRFVAARRSPAGCAPAIRSCASTPTPSRAPTRA